MDLTIMTILSFIIALIISTVIIYVVTKLFGETEDIKTALIAALIGTVIYAVVYYLIGHSLIAAIIAGVGWLLALEGIIQDRLAQILCDRGLYLDIDCDRGLVPPVSHGPCVKHSPLFLFIVSNNSIFMPTTGRDMT